MKSAQAAPALSGSVFTVRIVDDAAFSGMTPPVRLAMRDMIRLGLAPGDLVSFGDDGVVPVVPSSALEEGCIGIPHALERHLHCRENETVEISQAPAHARPSFDLGTTHPKNDQSIRFDDIGGLGPELGRLREMVELPLVRPDLFQHLGIAPPRGVLMSGPPGSGKTLIARALAAETNVAFFDIAGPEIADKHFGESEARLREVFEAARAHAPAILFIDEIESIAPRRETLSGDRQAEMRLVAQLLTLMDGLDERGDVVILAATNLPDLIDPALRRPGRFDREIVLSAPDAVGRAEILAIHTRSMPLAKNVNLSAIANRAHGFVGADLASLVREAGMSALRRAANQSLQELHVSADDFNRAFDEVRPSALRSFAVEVPTTSWADIVGVEDAKAAMRQAIEWPLRYADHFDALKLAAPRGILLYGPPGTGKTLLGKALAHAAEANFIAMNAGELLSMYLGQSERAIREVFARARSSAPTVLFFDEIDALAPKRSNQLSETTSRVVAQLLTEMDGLSSRAGIFILGATNRLEDIDPAIQRPGRFDLKILVDLPDRSDRTALLKFYLSSTPSEHLDLDAIAERSDGFSGADMAELVRAARQACLARSLDDDTLVAPTDLRITNADFETALAQKGRRV
ncbi:MAG: AAA family ATPase [Pseudomonadota bacterium]